MMKEKIIELKQISKKFRLDCKDNRSILAKILSFISIKKRKKELQALKDISFDVFKGEIVGVIGANGSGKSTLLKVITGIYQPEKGVVKSKGKLIYVGGFNQGLQPRLTMAENIYLRGALLELSRKDIKEKFWEIVEFSGLSDFLDTKVYQFSTGMTIRLNFSVTIHCIQHQNPEILLIDEVFGTGGDANFNAEALEKMGQLIKSGATVLLASHRVDIITKYCRRVVLLEKGKIVKIGRPAEVVKKYLSMCKKAG